MADKNKYDHTKVEKKWQEIWEESKIYETKLDSSNPHFYNLWMFPYPSAEGLHAGHAFASTGSDILGRFKRMNGSEVFQPIGYDSFGIHSENYAIKINKTPQEMLASTTEHYESQLRSLGHGYDWNRTVTTSDVDYYRWTQWLFIEMFKAGLAYKKKALVNFCPFDKTVLADEQVMSPKQAGKEPHLADGTPVEDKEGILVCERCGTVAEKRELEQWFFRITDYSEKLLQGLDKIDWSERVKIAQKEWIGKSQGLKINFNLKGTEIDIPVWTKFWETVFGVTFLVVAPEYAQKNLMEEIPTENKTEVVKYIKTSLSKSEQNRKEEAGEKTGVFSGLYAVNPVNKRSVPIWIADYVLMGVGTGAVMGVPAHDKRDFEFAKKYKIEIIQVVSYDDDKINQKVSKATISHEGNGKLVNSGDFDGLEAWGEGKERMAGWMIESNFADWKTTFHLRDWLISRQRYWGPPIPMIHCENCAREERSWFTDNEPKIHTDQSDWDHFGWYPEENLPVDLPVLKDYQPKGDGKGPLATHPEFYKTTCPHCGSEAIRETDVSDTFVDSSWYFLRYPSVGVESSDKMAFDTHITKEWLPVSLYFGGAEHSVLHLMYARFVTMLLHDLGKVSFDEPFPKFFAHGLMIKDGAKMSKSRGNVVNPDEYVAKFGADTLRLYVMFLGPMDGYPDFRDTGIEGMRKFVNKIWNLSHEVKTLKGEEEVYIKLNQTIKKVTENIQEFKYNTAIASIMELVNLITLQGYNQEIIKTLVLLLAPFAPHITEEIWSEILGEKHSIHKSSWPQVESKYLETTEYLITIQVNGKLRATLNIDTNLASDEKIVKEKAVEKENVSKWLNNKKIVRTVFVPNKLINFVIE